MSEFTFQADACLFCRCTSIHLAEHEIGYDDKACISFQAMCGCCGARGPIRICAPGQDKALVAAAAVDDWNTRCGVVEETELGNIAEGFRDLLGRERATETILRLAEIEQGYHDMQQRVDEALASLRPPATHPASEYTAEAGPAIAQPDTMASGDNTGTKAEAPSDGGAPGGPAVNPTIPPTNGPVKPATGNRQGNAKPEPQAGGSGKGTIRKRITRAELKDCVATHERLKAWLKAHRRTITTAVKRDRLDLGASAAVLYRLASGELLKLSTLANINAALDLLDKKPPPQPKGGQVEVLPSNFAPILGKVSSPKPPARCASTP